MATFVKRLARGRVASRLTEHVVAHTGSHGHGAHTSHAAHASSHSSGSDSGRPADIIFATSPQHKEPNMDALRKIADRIETGQAAYTDSVVRALHNRLMEGKPGALLNTVVATEYLVKRLPDGSPQTANFRHELERSLLAPITLLAKGLPADEGLEYPPPAVRAAALRALENWALTMKRPVFADAYRDATVHTPSPPAPDGSSGSSTPKRAPSRSSGGRTPQQRRPSDPPQPSTDASLVGVPSAPKEDEKFVTYYKRLLEQFDTLHGVRKIPLDDHQIKPLRSFMESNFERLRTIVESDTSGRSTDSRKRAMLAQFALERLRKFPDFKPPAPAPQSYPPPPATSYHRRTGSGVPAADSIPAPQAPAEAAPRAAGVSSAQRRMLCALATTFATQGALARVPPPHWSEPHFASLPRNLVGGHAGGDPAAAAQRMGGYPPHRQQTMHGMGPIQAGGAPGMHYPMHHTMPVQAPGGPGMHYQMQRPPVQPHPHSYQYAQYPTGGHL